MRNVADKSCREKSHILCSLNFSENCAVFEIMWKKCDGVREATDKNIT